jgi:hypothetical protein
MTPHIVPDSSGRPPRVLATGASQNASEGIDETVEDAGDVVNDTAD